MQKITEQLNSEGITFSLYSSFEPSQCGQVLIVDTIGVLSKAYQYALCAYIGGGFGVGIHNTLEAAVYGIPIAFGTNYTKFSEAIDLINRDIARSISSSEELEAWLSSLLAGGDKLDRVSQAAAAYTKEQSGATAKILRAIEL